MKQLILRSILLAASALATAVVIPAQSTEFNYQGSLVDGAGPANGNYDFEFALFDSLSGGAQLGSTLSRNNVSVSNGVFSVKLDFGDHFPGAARFLEIRVRVAGQPGITTLAPRQPVSSQPYSIKSLSAQTAANADNAATATNAQQLGGVAAGQYVLTGDARLSDARNPLPGSSSYIQNGTTQQTASDFNISGTGTANILNAGTQFNISGERVFSTGIQGTVNTFIGKNAGTGGNGNTFAGASAGAANTSGGNNSYFGAGAGATNTTSNSNSFFGHSAGGSNTGGSNSFFGAGTGSSNTAGSSNSFFGIGSGSQNTTGFVNAFFGASAGFSNVGGNGNTAIGSIADFGNPGLLSATAIGRRAFVSCSNCMVLGAINGINGATADTNVGIGTSTPTERLHVVGNGLFSGNLTVSGALNAALPPGSINYIQNQNAGPQASSNFNISGNGTVGGTLSGDIVTATTQFNIGPNRILSNPGNGNLFAGASAGISNTTGFNNSFFGFNAGASNSTGAGNAFFGNFAGLRSTTARNNAFFGTSTGEGNTIGENNSFFGGFAGQSNTSGNGNSAFGRDAGRSNSTGTNNSSLGFAAGFSTTTGSSNTFLGKLAGETNTTGSLNVVIGSDADVGGINLTNATAIGANSFVNQSNSLVLGSIVGVNGASSDTKVGIGTATPGHLLTIGNITGNPVATPAAKFAVFGNNNSYGIFRDTTNGVETLVGADSTTTDGTVGSAIVGTVTNHGLIFKTNGITRMTITPSGFVGISSLGLAGSTTLCRNAQNLIGTCSSSARYKTNINDFGSGIELIKKLRPVTFNWKDGGMLDIGLVAEEVAEVEPLLTTTNDSGAVEGVKYDRVGVVLINAIVEQQKVIEDQQRRIDALTKLVCLTNKLAEICRE